MTVLTPEFIAENNVSTVTVFRNHIEASFGARSLSFSGVEGDISTFFHGKLRYVGVIAPPIAVPAATHSVSDSISTDTKPVNQVIGSAVASVKPVAHATDNILERAMWDDASIAAYFDDQLDHLICGDLYTAMKREEARRTERGPDGKRPDSPFALLRNEAASFWSERGSALYQKSAENHGILMSISSDGVLSHQYKETRKALEPKKEPVPETTVPTNLQVPVAAVVNFRRGKLTLDALYARIKGLSMDDMVEVDRLTSKK